MKVDESVFNEADMLTLVDELSVKQRTIELFVGSNFTHWDSVFKSVTVNGKDVCIRSHYGDNRRKIVELGLYDLNTNARIEYTFETGVVSTTYDQLVVGILNRAASSANRIQIIGRHGSIVQETRYSGQGVFNIK